MPTVKQKVNSDIQTVRSLYDPYSQVKKSHCQLKESLGDVNWQVKESTGDVRSRNHQAM